MTDSDMDLNPKPAPGPWRVGVGLMVCDSAGHPVARCASTRGKFEYEEPNAQLIAAAPDLLAALCAARVYVEDAYECAFPNEAENKAVLKAIGDAITKAEGGAA